MAAKRRKKKGKGGGTGNVMRWLALPAGLGLALLAGYLMLVDGSDRGRAPHTKRPPVASSPMPTNAPTNARTNAKPTRAAPAPVVVKSGSHDRDHISEDSRRRLLEILESDGESEGPTR